MALKDFTFFLKDPCSVILCFLEKLVKQREKTLENKILVK